VVPRAETAVVIIMLDGDVRGSIITHNEDELSFVRTQFKNGGISEVSDSKSNTPD
jgi:hypothetical protein